MNARGGAGGAGPSNSGGATTAGASGSGVAAAGSASVGGGGNASAGASGNASGGSGGAPNASSAGAAGLGAGGAAQAASFSDDFEGIAPGMPPDPSKWSATVLTDCMSNAPKPTIDASQHHSGAQSLKVAGTASFCDYAMVGNSAAFKAVGSVVYGRYFVRFETALPAGHTAFMIFPDAMTGHALRMGGQNSALQWNRQADDATLPAQSPAGVALSKAPPVATWMCLEFMIDQAQGLISTWVDDTLVTGLVADATPTADVDMQWGAAYKPALTGVNIGWQNYGAGPMNLWFDDFALSSTRIHCQ
ncbi:MAG: hydrolase [Pseudomonadota bacterium]